MGRGIRGKRRSRYFATLPPPTSAAGGPFTSFVLDRHLRMSRVTTTASSERKAALGNKNYTYIHYFFIFKGVLVSLSAVRTTVNAVFPDLTLEYCWKQ